MSRRQIDQTLVTFYKALAEKVTNDDKATLEEKLMVLDRGLKIEQLKIRLKDEEFGKDFDNQGEDDE